MFWHRIIDFIPVAFALEWIARQVHAPALRIGVKSGVWKQTWVDDRGTVVNYRGEFADGKMSLRGMMTRPNGKLVSSRVCFSLRDDKSIRQVVEFSEDEGKTWEVYFDGIYRRKTTPAQEDTAS